MLHLALTIVVAVLAASHLVELVGVRRARNAPPAEWLRRIEVSQVCVHTTDDRSIEGLLRETCVDGIVIASARLVDDDVHLGGDVFIERSKILMVQRLHETSS